MNAYSLKPYYNAEFVDHGRVSIKIIIKKRYFYKEGVIHRKEAIPVKHH